MLPLLHMLICVFRYLIGPIANNNIDLLFQILSVQGRVDLKFPGRSIVGRREMTIDTNQGN